MRRSKKQIELLAPAKNAEIGIAAINCGADAVYVGAENFGARENAGNNLSDIEKLISYAHKFYARVYITLNTILNDSEIDEALKLINKAYSIGANGIIIQDMGLLELDLPPIPLIASTQMNSDSLEKILFLEKIGFNRVILPRELTLAEIKEIGDKTSIELECFVHGALCVSYSGQCYLSYAAGGRSANRGRCAQPCRNIYSLTDENGKILVKNRHLLSLKDLNRAEFLKELIDAGISSFKIEGRLKDSAYVANIIGFYRKKIDELIDGKNITRGSSGRVSFDFTPNPYKTFNRGYTDYGLCGKNENMSSIHTPKSLGEKIGIVEKTGKDYFTLSSENDLKNGDGICFFDSEQTLKGSLIHKIDNKKIYPDKMHFLKENTVIYRNYDKAFVKALEKPPCKRKITVSFTLEESPEGLKLDIRDEDGNTGTFSMPVKKTKAEKKELAESTVRNQLLKLNDTIFTCENITIKLKNIYFTAFSELNRLRRGAIQDISDAREKNRPRQTVRILVNDAPYPLKNIDYLGNVFNKKAVDFYKRHGASVIEPAAETGLGMNGRLVMITKHCVRRELGLCAKKTAKTPEAPQRNAPSLCLLDENRRKYELKFNCGRCRMEIRVFSHFA
ncbi:MAG: U32 family peptidase [Planctomycetes bacterium]|nr:U32 family peptidase [Planctomycetota bacterium]